MKNLKKVLVVVVILLTLALPIIMSSTGPEDPPGGFIQMTQVK